MPLREPHADAVEDVGRLLLPIGSLIIESIDVYRESIDITLKSCFCISEVTFGEKALAMTSTICRHAADGRAGRGGHHGSPD